MVGSLHQRALESSNDRVHFKNTHLDTTAALESEQQPREISVPNNQDFSSSTQNNIQQNEQKSNEHNEQNKLRSQLNKTIDSLSFDGVTFNQDHKQHKSNTDTEHSPKTKQSKTDQSMLDISALSRSSNNSH